MSFDSLYASFHFKVECDKKEDFDFAVDLLDPDKLSEEICEECDDEVTVKASRKDEKYIVSMSLCNAEVRDKLDDVLETLYAELKQRDLKLEGYVLLEDVDREHLRGDFSSGTGNLDWESTDYFLGYTVEQLRELQSMAKKKWGKPTKY